MRRSRCWWGVWGIGLLGCGPCSRADETTRRATEALVAESIQEGYLWPSDLELIVNGQFDDDVYMDEGDELDTLLEEQTAEVTRAEIRAAQARLDADAVHCAFHGGKPCRTQVVVLDAGHEPRKVLTQRWPEAPYEIERKFEGAGRTLHVRLRVTPQPGAVSLQVLSACQGPDPDYAADAFRIHKTMQGAQIEAAYDDRGRLLRAEWSEFAGNDQVDLAYEVLVTDLLRLVVPFPSEAMGVGGRFDVVEERGAEFRVTHWTITGIEGDRVSLLNWGVAHATGVPPSYNGYELLELADESVNYDSSKMWFAPTVQRGGVDVDLKRPSPVATVHRQHVVGYENTQWTWSEDVAWTWEDLPTEESSATIYVCDVPVPAAGSKPR